MAKRDALPEIDTDFNVGGSSGEGGFKKAGRKPKRPEDKEGNLVGIMLTDSEYENLKERAGLAPAATVLKDHLRRKTDFFKPLEQQAS